MKKLLTLLLIIPALCWGQKKDSLTADNPLRASSTADVQLGGTLIIYNTFIDTTWKFQKQDTVRILMLVCDTMVGFTSTMKFFSPCAQASNDNRCVWWQFGYEVWGSATSGITLLNVDRYGNIEPTIYLDENKKPLSKSLIVWMSKEINQ